MKSCKIALVFFIRSFLVYLDVDECLSDPCNISANCTDTEGSFKCQCNEGYTGNGFSCTSKDLKCLTRKWICITHLDIKLLLKI